MEIGSGISIHLTTVSVRSYEMKKHILLSALVSTQGNSPITVIIVVIQAVMLV